MKHGLRNRPTEELETGTGTSHASHVWDNQDDESGMECKPGDLVLIPFPFLTCNLRKTSGDGFDSAGSSR